MLLLRYRLKQLGHNAHLFGYSPTFESLEHASNRLVAMVDATIGGTRYALVGHSLGTVIIRNALPKFGEHQPAACFFFAPPMVACKAAKFFSRFRLYRLATGEMGQLLAQDDFMDALPIPEHIRIYAGTGGPAASWLPFRDEPNDGILSLREATGKFVAEVVEVPAIHTFIMNAKPAFDDMDIMLKGLGR